MEFHFVVNTKVAPNIVISMQGHFFQTFVFGKKHQQYKLKNRGSLPVRRASAIRPKAERAGPQVLRTLRRPPGQPATAAVHTPHRIVWMDGHPADSLFAGGHAAAVFQPRAHGSLVINRINKLKF